MNKSVKITLRLDLANPPKGHKGLRSETFVIGKDKNYSLEQLIYNAACHIIEFYGDVMSEATAEQMMESAQKAGRAIHDLVIATKLKVVD